MKSTFEILFDTCSDKFGKKNPPKTIVEFQEQCSKDSVMMEGVKAICEAMELHTNMALQETRDAWKKDHAELQVSRLIEEKKVLDLQEMVLKLEAELTALRDTELIVE